MADATYQPAVYRKQGGNELVVASSGLITVESGGDINLESGGDINLASGSRINVSAGGGIFSPVTYTTVASTFGNHGVLAIDAVTTNATTHTIGIPVAGCDLTICCIGVSTLSTGHLVGMPSTNVNFGTSLRRFIRFTAQDTSIRLIGLSTSQYAIASMSGAGVTITT